MVKFTKIYSYKTIIQIKYKLNCTLHLYLIELSWKIKLDSRTWTSLSSDLFISNNTYITQTVGHRILRSKINLAYSSNTSSGSIHIYQAKRQICISLILSFLVLHI